MLANDGAWNGDQIVPAQWVRDATTPQSEFQKPGVATRYFGYGYQVWLFPDLGGVSRCWGFMGRRCWSIRCRSWCCAYGGKDEGVTGPGGAGVARAVGGAGGEGWG